MIPLSFATKKSSYSGFVDFASGSSSRLLILNYYIYATTSVDRISDLNRTTDPGERPNQNKWMHRWWLRYDRFWIPDLAREDTGDGTIASKCPLGIVEMSSKRQGTNKRWDHHIKTFTATSSNERR